jgi:hypothetical protein
MCILALLENGANPNIKNNKGYVFIFFFVLHMLLMLFRQLPRALIKNSDLHPLHKLMQEAGNTSISFLIGTAHVSSLTLFEREGLPTIY